MAQVQLVKVLAEALPGVVVRRVGERVVGFANDRWLVDTDEGALLVKISRLSNPAPVHVEGQRRAQRLLTDHGVPTPEMLHLGESPAFDGRLLSVQRHLNAAAADEDDDAVLNGLDDRRRERFFVDFGRAVGLLHSLELDGFAGWLDDDGAAHPSWAEAIFPNHALRHLHDTTERPVDPAVLTTVADRLSDGLQRLPPIAPRLVHRDLHLGNTLLAKDGGFAGLIDFDLVREWDHPWDFAVRLEGVFEYWRCRTPFLTGYRELMGQPSEDFAFRCWLYSGIDAVRCASEYLAGNHGVIPPSAVPGWLATQPPPQ